MNTRVITICAILGAASVATSCKMNEPNEYKNYLYECTRNADGEIFIFERKDAELTIAIPGPSYFTITGEDGYQIEIPSVINEMFVCRKKHIGTYTRG